MAVKADYERSLVRPDYRMAQWMCGVTLSDKFWDAPKMHGWVNRVLEGKQR